MTTWIEACAVGDVDAEHVTGLDRRDRSQAIFRSPENAFYATDGYCTHERNHLADGLVLGDTIECPLHNGRFDYRSGRARGAPVCVDLVTYPVKVEGGRVFVGLE